jgi:hypothetical protein
MSKSIVRWLIVPLLIVVVACGGTERKAVVHDIEGEVWSEAEEFRYTNEDSLTKRDISIVVRYSKPYVADSLPLKVLTISPDSMLLDEPFTLHIPHLADMYPEEQSFVYRSHVVLGRKGDYIFRLTPDNPVEGIAAVGIVVSE